MNTINFLVALAVLFALDAWSTSYMLLFGGRELNPLLAKLMAGMGTDAALALVKGVSYAAIAWFAWHDQIAPIYEKLILAGYIVVVGRNLYLVHRT
ncbi:MAG: DUF5658 family protein [Acidobacteriaceae bacterium]